MGINLKSQNIKIYAIILLASLFVVLLGLNSYNKAKEKIIELSDKNNIAVSKNIVSNFQIWLDERINSLIRASKFIQNSDIVDDDEKIAGFIKLFKQNAKEFDLMQLLREDGEILTSMADATLKREIEEKFKELFLKDEDITSLKIGQNLIQVAEIPTMNWFIGAGTNNEEEILAMTREALKNALNLLFAFVALAFLANSLHNFMYNKIKKVQDEYETLLAHRAKMSEAGELISGISHQFIQPVNSLKLMLSSAIMLKKEGKLSDEELLNLLEKGQSSIELLSKTIEIFRNFYKSAENVSEFDIQTSVRNLITLMHTELSRANVSVKFSGFEEMKVCQIENIIQQILLILIHNAKDSLVESYKDEPLKRVIELKFRSFEDKCYIGVYDSGGGVSYEMSKKIFTWLNTTKKQGNGIGLYFAKKLAREKLNGDITLAHNLKPTIFELSFEKNLKG